MRLNVTRKGQQTSFHGRTVTLGEGGLGASIEGELWPGESVILNVTLPQCDITLHPRAEVRYRTGSLHGFEFIDLSPLQLIEVRQCCRRLAELS